MRKLIEASFVSLDGVVEGAEKWALPYFLNEENQKDSLSKLTECDAFLLGRLTFEMLESIASGIKGDPYYDRIGKMPKFVPSTTLREGRWNGTALKGDIAKEISTLKQQPGKNIMRYGNGVLDKMLVTNKLIDELQLAIIPVTVGTGRRLFEGVDTSSLGLKVKGVTHFKSGIVTVSYVPG